MATLFLMTRFYPCSHLGQSILSSIHNERAATVELKGDKQEESMVYTASSKKEVGICACADIVRSFGCDRLLVCDCAGSRQRQGWRRVSEDQSTV